MLVPCDACGRHLRDREHRCPFCLTDRAPTSLVEPVDAPRLSRAALVVAASMVVAGCPLAVRYGGPPPGEIQPAPAPTAPASAPAATDASTTGAANKPAR